MNPTHDAPRLELSRRPPHHVVRNAFFMRVRGIMHSGLSVLLALAAVLALAGVLALATVPASAAIVASGDAAFAAEGAPASAPTPKPAPVAKPTSAPPAAHAGAMVKIKSGTDMLDAYLVAPKGAGTHPAVVVIQEWWGLNDQIKSVADTLAGKGYVALAPDLYRGKVSADPNVAMELMRSLPEPRASGDLAAAFAYLRAHASVGSKPIGSIGFCMGGGFSLKLALAEPKLAACVICYGRLESDPAKLKAINSPVLGIFGGTDQGIPQEMIEGFKTAMEGAGKRVEIKVYPEAGHGFLNPNNPGHRPEESKDAWSRIDAFFAKYLRTE